MQMVMIMMMKNTDLQIVLHGLTNFISPKILCTKYHYFPHFANEETEAQRV